VGTSSDRLLGLWWEGRRVDASLMAVHSDDDGASWSAAVAINDRRPSLRARISSIGYAPSTIGVSAAGAGAVAAWLARPAGTCAEVRVSRTIDGAVWSPSVAVHPLAGPPLYEETDPILTLAEDGAGRLVLILRDAGHAYASTSLDGGATWSAPAVIVTSPAHQTNVVTASDGAFVVVVRTGDEFTTLRSEHGGFTWDPFWLATLPQGSANRLTATGDRLLIDLAVGVWDYTLESTDGGRTWTTLPYVISAEPWEWVVGAASGAVLVQKWASPDGTFIVRPGQDPMPYGTAPALEGWPAGAPLACGEDNVGLLYVTGGPANSRVEFVAATSQLLRDDSIRSLNPPPDLGALFPLPTYPVAGGACGGMLDPDAAVIADASRPLVLYQVEGSARLLVTRAPGDRLRLDW